MKEIVTTKMIEQTTHVWVADDGKEFPSEDACRRHERERKMVELKTAYDRLVIASPNIPYTDWCNDTFGIDIVRVCDLDDWYVIEDWFTLHNGDFYGDKPTQFPANLVIAATEDYASVSQWDPKKLLEEMQKATQKIEDTVCYLNL